jgi:uncharacterized protein YlxP (DUF503 family)
MFVGVCRLELRIVGNNSLKGKRKVVRSAIDRTRSKFNAAVAEVGYNDDKRRALIGATVLGNSASHVDAMLSRICGFVESLALAPVTSRQTEVIPMGGDIGLGQELPVEAAGEDGPWFEEEDGQW